MMTSKKYNELEKKFRASDYEGKVEIKKIEAGTYGYQVVTKKSWGLFINDKLYNTGKTKTAVENIAILTLYNLGLI